MILTIRKIGDPILEKPCREINNPLKYKRLIKDMAQTAEKYNAAGLAANQVGESVQIILWRNEFDNLNVAINPKIEKDDFDKWQEGEEGCLSVPKIGAIIKRPDLIKISYSSQWGTDERVTAMIGGMPARIFCHECDHLNGILFLQRAEKIFYIK